MTHPAVLEAAAVGVPHEIKGEVIVLFCVLRPGEVDDAGAARLDLRAGGRARWARPCSPEAVHVVPPLPRTRSGKVMRRVARAAYLGTDPGDISALENPFAVEAIRDAAAGKPA